MARDDVGFMQAAVEAAKRKPMSRSPRFLDAIMVTMGYGEHQLSECRAADGSLVLELLVQHGLLGLSESAWEFAKAMTSVSFSTTTWWAQSAIAEAWLEAHGERHYGR